MRYLREFLLILLVLVSFIAIHETIHYNNCSYFGGNATYGFYRGSPAVYCEGADFPERHLGDSFNDALGYTLIPMFVLYLAIKL